MNAWTSDHFYATLSAVQRGRSTVAFLGMQYAAKNLVEAKPLKQRKLAYVQQGENKALEEDLFVHLTIYDVPASLLKEFGEKIIRPYYPEGVSQAIKDLMRKAILEQDSTRQSQADA